MENEVEAKTLEIVLEDELINSEMILSYTIFDKYDAITRNVKFINNGESSLSLTRALSMCLDLPDYDYEMIHLSGTWTRERHIKTRKLEHGVQEIYSARGASSPHHNPFIGLKRPTSSLISISRLPAAILLVALKRISNLFFISIKYLFKNTNNIIE